jgi:Na+/H+ antiporter NhaC
LIVLLIISIVSIVMMILKKTVLSSFIYFFFDKYLWCTIYGVRKLSTILNIGRIYLYDKEKNSEIVADTSGENKKMEYFMAPGKFSAQRIEHDTDSIEKTAGKKQ